jgi:hypothetical protein
MFMRMFKSPFGHRRHYADAANQQEGGSASPLSQHPVTHEHETLAPQDDSYDLAIDPACLASPAIIYRRLCCGHGEAKTITY